MCAGFLCTTLTFHRNQKYYVEINGSGKQGTCTYKYGFHDSQHHESSHITIPTYVAGVDISASQVCSFLCRDGYICVKM